MCNIKTIDVVNLIESVNKHLDLEMIDTDEILEIVEKKGYNQAGKNNNNYKNGISTYRRDAIKAKGGKCQQCGSTRHLMVHHKDGNRSNNALSNLQVLCWSWMAGPSYQ